MSRELAIIPPAGELAVEKACAMLARATSTDEVKHIRDVAVAMKAYARTQKAGHEIALDAGEIILRADKRLGELSRPGVQPLLRTGAEVSAQWQGRTGRLRH